MVFTETLIFTLTFHGMFLFHVTSVKAGGQSHVRVLQNLDVILTVDPSLAARPRDRAKSIDWMKNTISMVSDVGSNNRVAVVASTKPNTSITFDTFSLPVNKQIFLRNISHLKSNDFESKPPKTRIENLLSSVSHIAENARTNALKLIIFVMDHTGHKGNQLPVVFDQEIQGLKQKNFTVFYLRLGKKTDGYTDILSGKVRSHWFDSLDDLYDFKLPSFSKTFHIPVLMVQGKSPAIGVVHAETNGTRAPICLVNVSVAENDVICELLGFNGTLQAIPLMFKGNQSEQGFALRLDSSCNSSSFVKNTENCFPKMTVQNCTWQEKRVCNIPVQLRGVGMTSSGRNLGLVEIYYNGYWGTLDQVGWTINNSDVVCHQLRYKRAVAEFINVRIPGDETVKQSVLFQCRGDEPNLSYCPQGVHTTSLNTRAAGVVCLSNSSDIMETVSIKVGFKVEMRPDTRQLGVQGNSSYWTDLMNRPITAKDEVHINTSDQSLVMDHAKSRDSGTYIYHGVKGMAYYTVYVEVQIYDMAKSNQIQYIRANTTARIFGCNAKGTPNPVVAWRKDGALISPGMVMNPLTPSSPMWEIADVRKSDTGNYTCTASQQIGRVKIVYPVTTRLVVYDPPSVRVIPPYLIRQEGQNATLLCKATGTPKPVIKWSFKDKTIAESISDRLIFHTGTLRREKHNGRYLCTAELREVTNGSEPYRASASVHLQVDVPPKIMQMSRNITVKEGANATLFCRADGAPLPGISWTRNGSRIIINGALLEGNRSLYLINISRERHGLYTCTAYNRVGTVNESTYLIVELIQDEDYTPTVQDTSKTKALDWYLIAGPVLSCVVVIALGVVLWHICRTRLQIKEVRKYQEEVDQIQEPVVDEWEVSPCSLFMRDYLGIGSFGEVWSAIANNIRGTDESRTVAVKRLKRNSTDAERKALLSEIDLGKSMGNTHHPNIVNFLGCITLRGPMMLVMEYVPYGDLLGYLRMSRGVDDKYYSCAEKCRVEITNYDMISFARQIAAGMSFLTSRKILHRDLAARNVLVGKNNTCKITDFGLAFTRSMYKYGNTARKGRLPIKWSAPELLFSDSKYPVSYKCDVWSYGIVLFEIVTLGGVPYPDWGEYKVIYELQAHHYRIIRPEHVSHEFYEIMTDCWHEDPADRPNFDQLHDTMLRILEDQHYLDLDMTRYESNRYAYIDNNAVSLENFDEELGKQPSKMKSDFCRGITDGNKESAKPQRKNVSFGVFAKPRSSIKKTLIEKFDVTPVKYYNTATAETIC